ncbi:hypothetical protein K8I61_20515 [bacterium]|nr:hypothetical protein [bacterium]
MSRIFSSRFSLFAGVVVVAVVTIAAILAIRNYRPPGPEFVRGTVEVLPKTVRVGSRVTWTIDVRLDKPLLEDGRVVVRFPHYYFGAQTPRELYQAENPEEPGYVTASLGKTPLPVFIESTEFARRAVVVTAPKEGIPAGRSIRFVINDIEAPRVVRDDFSFRVLADTDADDYHGIISTVSKVRVRAAEPERLACVADTFVPRDAVPAVGCRLEDLWGNPAGKIDELTILSRSHPETAGTIKTIAKPKTETATIRIPIAKAPDPGVWRHFVSARSGDIDFQARPNPTFVSDNPAARRVVWGDIHGHSALDDGVGSPENYYRYARDVSFLDVASLTTHDWQLEPGEWTKQLAATRRFHEPGRFVTVDGVEINWRGHEIAYFFDAKRAENVPVGREGGAHTMWEEDYAGMATSEMMVSYEKMLEFYGMDNLVTAAHSTLAAGMGTETLRPSLPAELAIEVYSAHGNNMCRECPLAPASTPFAISVHDALDAGMRVAFIAAGDSHDGRPGNTQFSASPGGLTAFAVDTVDARGVYEAMRDRRTYATSGCRVHLEFTLNKQPMGSVVAMAARMPRVLRFRMVSNDAKTEIALVRNGETVVTVDEYMPGTRWTFTDRNEGDAWYYVRARANNGTCHVWTSPIWLEEAS